MSEFNVKVFFEVIEQISTQNLISKEEVLKIIQDAVIKSFHSKFDPDANLEFVIDENQEKFELINHSKLVIKDENSEYRIIEIPLKEAQKIKKDVQVGDFVSETVDFFSYSKIISQQIKQIFTQNIKERKKESIWEKHKSLKGEMIDVTVSSITKNYVIFNLEDGTTAFMPSQLKNNNIPLKIGQRTKVYVEDVLKESKDSQILVSNGSKIVIKRILEEEVPEISDGTIEIYAIARMAGDRTKIAVKSNDPNIEPIGTIVGQNKMRINAINQRLEGEKLDIVLWNANENEFLINAIAPSKVISIVDKKDEEGNIIENQKIVIVPNQHKSLAIGKKGVNARLTVSLVKKRLDILSLDEANEKGIAFEWTGNIEESELPLLENGTFNNRYKGYRKNNNFGQAKNNNSIIHDFDQDILSFNEELSEQDNKVLEQESFDVEDIIFSEEELEQMQSEFEFDDELSDMLNNEELEQENN